MTCGCNRRWVRSCNGCRSSCSGCARLRASTRLKTCKHRHAACESTRCPRAGSTIDRRPHLRSTVSCTSRQCQISNKLQATRKPPIIAVLLVVCQVGRRSNTRALGSWNRVIFVLVGAASDARPLFRVPARSGGWGRDPETRLRGQHRRRNDRISCFGQISG